MRVDLEKILIVGPRPYKDTFFHRVQSLGIIEFISQAPLPLEKPREISILMDAIHILKQEIPAHGRIAFDTQDPVVLASHIVDLNEQKEKENETKRYLEKEIARIEPFGDFSLEEIEAIEKEAKLHIQFFFAKEEEREKFLDYPGLLHLGERYGLSYFVSIASQRISLPHLIEMKFDRSLHELQSDLASVNLHLDMLHTELSQLAPSLHFLEEGLIQNLNRYNLKLSMDRAQETLERSIFSATGWVPINKIKELEALKSEIPFYFVKVAKEEGDKIPTHLDNRGLKRSGEDLINIYDTPSTSDRDPSSWVFFAFALFFSMIISDAGYGLILLGISLFLKYKFKKKKGLVKRILNLSTFLAIGCIIWGILSASYLGITVAPDSPLRKVSIIDFLVQRKASYFLKEKGPPYEHYITEYPELKSVQDPMKFVMGVKKDTGTYTIYEEFVNNAMLELVLFIGAVHIFLGMLRYAYLNWAGIGWAIAIVGGYLYFPVFIKATSLIHYLFLVPPKGGSEVGLYLLFGGIALATILALFQKRLGGLAEPMNVVQVFADIMSYLRIYALALAGMIMASTFNTIAMKMPIYVAPLILLAGHTINFVLAIIGGIIHGLRLNFIEWYHYSFEGGGRPFKPLALLELE